MKIKVYKPTLDDWYESYKLTLSSSNTERQMLVECIFNGNIMEFFPDEMPIWRTCVWGTDDCGMEFDCSTEAEAWNKFLQVIGMEFVDMQKLSALGFVPT